MPAMLFKWIHITGITTAAFLAGAAVVGFMGMSFELHEHLAIATLAAGAAHASLVLYKQFKFRRRAAPPPAGADRA